MEHPLFAAEIYEVERKALLECLALPTSFALLLEYI